MWFYQADALIPRFGRGPMNTTTPRMSPVLDAATCGFKESGVQKATVKVFQSR